jgi:hypothetical protein
MHLIPGLEVPNWVVIVVMVGVVGVLITTGILFWS